MHFTIVTLDANRSQSTTIPGELTQQLRWSTQEPGGCLECSFRLLLPLRTVPAAIGANYDLRILDHHGCFWRGRIERIQAVRTGAGEWWDVVAVGYGASLSDQVDNTENLANTVTTTGISNVIGTWAPAVQKTTIEASGITLTNTAAIPRAWDTPAERINFLKAFGYSDNSQMLAHIYPDNTADANIELTVKKRPSTADYRAYLGDIQGSWGFDFASYANAVTVVYNAGASNLTRTYTLGQNKHPDGVNMAKVKLLSVPEITNSADATYIADAALLKARSLRMVAQSIVMPISARLTDANGQDEDVYRLRSGKILQLVDMRPESQSNIAWNNACLITRTDWDNDAETLHITPEGLDSGIDALVSRIRNASEAGSRIV